MLYSYIQIYTGKRRLEKDTPKDLVSIQEKRKKLLREIDFLDAKKMELYTSEIEIERQEKEGSLTDIQQEELQKRRFSIKDERDNLYEQVDKLNGERKRLDKTLRGLLAKKENEDTTKNQNKPENEKTTL